MMDFDRFEQNFREWSAQAPLPLMLTSLEILTAQVLSRGPRAMAYAVPRYVAALLLLTGDPPAS